MTNSSNIVVVLCDQMRRDAMSCAGDPNVATPELDALAESGVRFTNANSTYPICVPARQTFVTGEHAHTRHSHHIWRLSPAERTFAHELAEAGYQTAYIGKWHLADLGRNRPVPPELQGGFDYWRGFELRNAPFETAYYADDDPTPHPINGYQTDGLFDLGFEFLDERRDDDPFCLVISVEPPHPPFDAPDPYLDSWEDRTLELRPNVPYPDPDAVPDSHAQWGDVDESTGSLADHEGYHGDTVLDEMRSYYAMIENLDDNVGRLLTELEARGIRDDTAVMFLSDHGEMMGSHGLMAKQHPYEESVGIPFIVSHPGGGIDGGQTIAEPTCTEDWYPTILGFAGIGAEQKPGVDLGPLMRGEQPTLERPGVLLEFVREIRPDKPYHDETWRGFRSERYKYTVKGDPQRGGTPWQLYDLQADPYERTNLIEDPDHQGVARQMHGLLRDAIIEYRDDYALDSAFGFEAVNVPSSPFDPD